MTPDALLVALAECGITIVPEGQALRFAGPEGAMTEPLAAALSQHKLLILAVFASVRNPSGAAAWRTVIDWLEDGKPGPVPPPVIAAGEKLGLPYGTNEYPPAYGERLRMALRVRALLAAFAAAPRRADAPAEGAANAA